MTHPTVGLRPTEDDQRDAIHVAIAPVVAVQPLKPGDHVGLLMGEVSKKYKPHIGIIDPFLNTPVNRGARVWLFLYPNTVTSLKHHWTHPAFDVSAEESEEWLRQFCDSNDYIRYEDLLSGLDNGMIYVAYGALIVRDQEAHGHIPEEFWDHLEAVTGRKFTDRPSYFSCTC